MNKLLNTLIVVVLLLGHTACKKESAGGCTDPNASNYDPDAVSDDGSCSYGNTNTVLDAWQQLDIDDGSFYLETLNNVQGNTHQWYDFDSDGDLDLIYKYGNKIYWKQMNGTSLSGANVLLDITGVSNSIGTAETITSFSPADLNQDGYTDFLFKVNFRGALSYLKPDILRALNTGSNTFVDVKIFADETGADPDEYPEKFEFGKTADFDNDNLEEIVFIRKHYNFDNEFEYAEWNFIDPSQNWETIRNDVGGMMGREKCSYKLYDNQNINGDYKVHTFDVIDGVTFAGRLASYITLESCNNTHWDSRSSSTVLSFDDEVAMQHTFFLDENSVYDMIYNNLLGKNQLYIYHDVLSYSSVPFVQNSNYEVIPFEKGVLSCMALDHDGDGNQELIITTPSGDDFNVEVYELSGLTRNTQLTYVKTIAQNVPGKQREFAAVMSKLDVNNDGVEDIYFEILGLVLLAK